MALGISGDIAQDFLLDQLKRQAIQQQVEQAARQAALEEQRFAAEARRADLQERQFAADQEERQADREFRAQQAQRQIDLQDLARREKANTQGVRQLISEGILTRQGGLSQDDRRSLAAMQVAEGGEFDPRLLVEPEDPEAASQRELQQYRAKRLIDLETRPPERAPQGPEPQYEWVVRGGQPVQIRKGTAQAGDRPYDATAERQQAAQAQSPYSAERARRTIESVDSLLSQVNRRTVGYGNLLFGNIPETEALGFAQELETLKSNIAFGELQQMRDASKTGGALGQVSDREAKLLSDTLGALNPRQSPDRLRKQLQRVKDSVNRWQGEVAKYGRVAQPGQTGESGQLQSGVTEYVRDPQTGRLVRKQ